MGDQICQNGLQGVECGRLGRRHLSGPGDRGGGLDEGGPWPWACALEDLLEVRWSGPGVELDVGCEVSRMAPRLLERAIGGAID